MKRRKSRDRATVKSRLPILQATQNLGLVGEQTWMRPATQNLRRPCCSGRFSPGYTGDSSRERPPPGRAHHVKTCVCLRSRLVTSPRKLPGVYFQAACPPPYRVGVPGAHNTVPPTRETSFAPRSEPYLKGADRHAHTCHAPHLYGKRGAGHRPAPGVAGRPPGPGGDRELRVETWRAAGTVRATPRQAWRSSSPPAAPPACWARRGATTTRACGSRTAAAGSSSWARPRPGHAGAPAAPTARRPSPKAPHEPVETWGEFDPGKGFLVGRGSAGELSISGVRAGALREPDARRADLHRPPRERAHRRRPQRHLAAPGHGLLQGLARHPEADLHDHLLDRRSTRTRTPSSATSATSSAASSASTPASTATRDRARSRGRTPTGSATIA